MPWSWTSRAWKWRFRHVPVTPFLLLYFLTFGILLPSVCWDLPYSHYYQAKSLSLQRTREHLADSLHQAKEAIRYLETLEVDNRSTVPTVRETQPPKLVITVVTTPRDQGRDHHYLLRTVSTFHRLLKSCANCASHQLVICNVHFPPDQHADAVVASRAASRTVQRYHSHLRQPPAPPDPDNLFEKEKQDYLFCLNQSLTLYQSRHVLLVEDDALPKEDVFEVLRDLLERRSAKRQVRDALYLKLYHPERLQGYINPEPMRILEWLAVGVLGASVMTLVCHQIMGKLTSPRAVFLLFTIYCMAFIEMLGRYYFIEFRRYSPQLYTLVPVTECCTPAMVYSASSGKMVVRYLQEIQCKPGLAKDTALYWALSQHKQHSYVVEPNVFSHIGFYSTLRGSVRTSDRV